MSEQTVTVCVPCEPCHAITFDPTFYFLGPSSPDEAFDDIGTLTEWYRTTVDCWKNDCFSPAGTPNSDSVTTLGPQAFFHEAFKTAIRQFQSDLFRNLHSPSVSSRAEVRAWCDFFRIVVADDELLVNDRSLMLVKAGNIPDEIRNSEGVADVLSAAEVDAAFRGWRSAIRLAGETDHSGHVAFVPDDPRILILWAALARAGRRVQGSVCSFLESEPANNVPPKAMLDHAVPLIWRLMRQLGEPCIPEPIGIADLLGVRNALDQAVRWCDQDANSDNRANLPKRKSVKTPTHNTTPLGPAPPGMIQQGTLYTLDEAKLRSGWSDHAFRKARRHGLQVLYVCRRAFVMGDELIRHIQEQGDRRSTAAGN